MSNNAKLMAMLKGAKNVMNKVDENDNLKGNRTTPSMNSTMSNHGGYNNVNMNVTSDQLLTAEQVQARGGAANPMPTRQPSQAELQMQYEAQMRSQYPQAQTQQPYYPPQTTSYQNNGPIQQTLRNINTTKMDPKIVESMVNNPMIPKVPHSLGGEAFSIEDVASMINQQPYQAQPVNENTQMINGQKMITISEAELDTKIKNAVYEFMSTTFTKTLTEATIKKTMATLIKEGKLKVTQKKRT